MSDESPEININQEVIKTGENPYREPLTELYKIQDHEEAQNLDVEKVWADTGWTSEKQPDGSTIRTNSNGEQIKVVGVLDEPGYRVTRIK